ncbi:MAG: sigma factor-like helix-turn-helix DNA-binding protein [Blautia massiliensis (ex Durand et al. 2017)]|uniref:sigma factor-like helix-turn-helix DNA-binding protein n=1 Tax=uncultured Subdoligranulum sp. TaxID=512298 RepID=UPI00262E4754|nr:sigma factor-like helix-turn-helix DNA-binding protein [uncultured Subdoligranulum sp.]
MKTIDLEKYYTHPLSDGENTFVEVSDEVWSVFRASQRAEAAHERRKFRHKAHYSLDREDGIENDVLAQPPTPGEILEQDEMRKRLHTALTQLPTIQARRIYARFYLDMSVAEIAQIEGVDRRRVWDSIQCGLKKLAQLLDAGK